MTTDDLRTRAKEAADGEYPSMHDEEVSLVRGGEPILREGFIAGYLAHANQQPSREQLRTEFLYRLRTVAAHYRAAGKHGDPVEPGWIEREADLAVLALLNGDKS